MAHGESCSEANGLACTCMCGGVGHGRDLLSGIFNIDPGKRSAVVGRVRELYDKGPQRNRLLMVPTMVTACNSGVAVIDALQASCLNLAQDLYLGLSGDKMIAIVAKKVKDHRANVSGEKNKKEDSHLWCSFLVSIAQGIDSFSGSNIQDRTYLGGVVAGKLGNSGIICSYDADRKPRVEGKVSDRLWEAVSVEVTDHVVDAIMTAAMGGLEARTLSMLLRIIALFVCPNAAAHPVVFKECLGTLLKLVPIEDLVVEMAEIVVP